MNAPRTVREALMAEILGDLDTILVRIETFPGLIATAEEKLTSTVAALDEAGEKYRIAVNAYTEQAKADLTEYLDIKTIAITSKTVEEQRTAIQEAARLAFRAEVSDKATNLSIALGEAAKEFRRSMFSRLMEHTITALIASSFTASLVYAIVKIN